MKSNDSNSKKSRCHTKRRMGTTTRAHPSFGTTTKDLKVSFLVMHLMYLHLSKLRHLPFKPILFSFCKLFLFNIFLLYRGHRNSVSTSKLHDREYCLQYCIMTEGFTLRIQFPKCSWVFKGTSNYSHL